MSIPNAEEFDEIFKVTLPPRPYPGLRPFEKNEWPIFFGRERMADAVVAQLLSKRVLVIHGDSGCGKSSLVQAGVLPRLEQENARGQLRWRTCVSLPREEPLWNLARSLASLGGPDLGDARAITFLRALNCGDAAPESVADLLQLPAQDQVCILIDQFEEVFAHARRFGPEEAQLLTQALIALFGTRPDRIYVVLTMRSEFLGACARFNGFAEMVNATQYLLPRMSHNDLVRAIREPAALYGGEISYDLTERLIADVGDNQDELPLIQHGLMVLYRSETMAQTPSNVPPDPDGAAVSRWRLGMDQFRPIGSLPHLLSRHADDVMAQAERAAAPTDNASHVIENLFRALTDINADTPAIRRPRTLVQLAATVGRDTDEVRRIIDVFRADGVSFLKPYGNGRIEPNELIDISHEALIRCWQKLAEPKNGWLFREFRDGLIWRALLVQAESFEQDASNVLGLTATDERSQWILSRNQYWAQRYGGGWDRVQKLLDASRVERDRRRAEQEAARMREEEVRTAELKMKATRRFAFAIAGGCAAVTFGIISVVAFNQSHLANERYTDALAKNNSYADTLDTSVQAVREARSAIESARANDSVGQGPDLTSKLLQAQNALAQQADKLSNAADMTIIPRIYIRIADEEQLSAARAFENRLELYEPKGVVLSVAGIELKKNSPSHGELRCFRAAECKGVGRQLVDKINGLLLEPQVKLTDLSGRYENSTEIRPQHYELWFAKGDITMKP